MCKRLDERNLDERGEGAGGTFTKSHKASVMLESSTSLMSCDLFKSV